MGAHGPGGTRGTNAAATVRMRSPAFLRTGIPVQNGGRPAWLCACPPNPGHPKEVPPLPPRPHIVLIVADGHSFDAGSALGTPALRTPALDALAARGAALTRTYIEDGWSGAVCVPSRACLLTGTGVFSATRPREGPAGSDAVPRAGLAAAGARWENAGLDPGRATLPEILRAGG